MITTILWDVDATLLDFLAAEKAAIKKLFQEFDLGECTDEMIGRYSKINRFVLGAAGMRRTYQTGGPGRKIPGVF